MRYLAMTAMLLIAEFVVAVGCIETVDWPRLASASLLPMALETLKYILMTKHWPSRLAKIPLYALVVEAIRFLAVIVAILGTTSLLDKRYKLYALIFCGNFCLSIIMGFAAYGNKNE